jgi:predicted nuclease of predicted toxin-antitoxin system
MRFLADENFHGKLLAGLCAAMPEIDVLRVQDTHHSGMPDPELLAWAAEQGRILLTHDVQTAAGYAYERVKAGLPMPGIIEVRTTQGLGAALDDLLLLIGASTPDEFENQVRYVPMHYGES